MSKANCHIKIHIVTPTPIQKPLGFFKASIMTKIALHL